MSIPVSLDELREVAVAAGAVRVPLDRDRRRRLHTSSRCRCRSTTAVIACVAGKSSCANASARPNVSLLWPPATVDDYSLIVDGHASVDGSTVRVVPSRAVRHRPAPGGGNDCAPVTLG